MIVFARGSITDPDALAPYVDEEMRVVGLEGSSVHAVQERVDSLPFVVEGLMSVEYDEIYPI